MDNHSVQLELLGNTILDHLQNYNSNITNLFKIKIHGYIEAEFYTQNETNNETHHKMPLNFDAVRTINQDTNLKDFTEKTVDKMQQQKVQKEVFTTPPLDYTFRIKQELLNGKQRYKQQETKNFPHNSHDCKNVDNTNQIQVDSCIEKCIGKSNALCLENDATESDEISQDNDKCALNEKENHSNIADAVSKETDILVHNENRCYIEDEDAKAGCKDADNSIVNKTQQNELFSEQDDESAQNQSSKEDRIPFSQENENIGFKDESQRNVMANKDVSKSVSNSFTTLVNNATERNALNVVTRKNDSPLSPNINQATTSFSIPEKKLIIRNVTDEKSKNCSSITLQQAEIPEQTQIRKMSIDKTCSFENEKFVTGNKHVDHSILQNETENNLYENIVNNNTENNGEIHQRVSHNCANEVKSTFEKYQDNTNSTDKNHGNESMVSISIASNFSKKPGQSCTMGYKKVDESDSDEFDIEELVHDTSSFENPVINSKYSSTNSSKNVNMKQGTFNSTKSKYSLADESSNRTSSNSDPFTKALSTAVLKNSIYNNVFNRNSKRKTAFLQINTKRRKLEEKDNILATKGNKEKTAAFEEENGNIKMTKQSANDKGFANIRNKLTSSNYTSTSLKKAKTNIYCNEVNPRSSDSNINTINILNEELEYQHQKSNSSNPNCAKFSTCTSRDRGNNDESKTNRFRLFPNKSDYQGILLENVHGEQNDIEKAADNVPFLDIPTKDTFDEELDSHSDISESNSVSLLTGKAIDQQVLMEQHRDNGTVENDATSDVKEDLNNIDEGTNEFCFEEMNSSKGAVFGNIVNMEIVNEYLAPKEETVGVLEKNINHKQNLGDSAIKTESDVNEENVKNIANIMSSSYENTDHVRENKTSKLQSTSESNLTLSNVQKDKLKSLISSAKKTVIPSATSIKTKSMNYITNYFPKTTHKILQSHCRKDIFNKSSDNRQINTSRNLSVSNCKRKVGNNVNEKKEAKKKAESTTKQKSKVTPTSTQNSKPKSHMKMVLKGKDLKSTQKKYEIALSPTDLTPESEKKGNETQLNPCTNSPDDRHADASLSKHKQTQKKELKKGKSNYKRRSPCGKCGPCLITENCGKCKHCINKPALKQKCALRQCDVLYPKKSKARKHPSACLEKS